MKILARLLLALSVFAAPLVFGGPAQDETHELERLASYDPRQALSTGEQRLRESQSSADRHGQVNALRLLVLPAT